MARKKVKKVVHLFKFSYVDMETGESSERTIPVDLHRDPLPPNVLHSCPKGHQQWFVPGTREICNCCGSYPLTKVEKVDLFLLNIFFPQKEYKKAA